jgi:pimeloyl-ACP methyl ester carboxylesterase
MFHGGGTNSRIFRTQCRALTKAIQHSIRLVYVEAPYKSYPGPDVARIFENMGPFKAWLRWRHSDQTRDPSEATNRLLATVKTAMDEDDGLGASGPWVGMLGFSQGAKLCASLLYTQQYCAEVLGKSNPYLQCFRFAVLLAGRAPLVWLDEGEEVPRGLVDAATLSTADFSGLPAMPTSGRLKVPTLHVHGLKDPGLQLHRQLLHRCCDSGSVKVLEWDGAHSVAIKPDDVEVLAKEILSLVKMAQSQDPVSG